MGKISVEKDGLITETFHDNENKGVIQERTINHQPILENNKKLYTQNDGYSPDKGLKRVASIPTIILEIWAKEYNGDQNNGNWFALPKDVQTKILKEKLNSSDIDFLELHQEDFNGTNNLYRIKSITC